MNARPDLAIFLATSGHSGVDRVMRNLAPEFVARGLRVDLLQVRGHGPNWRDLPEGARVVDLGASHVHTSLPALVRYLRRHRPAALLSDKDKVNRAALWARALARVETRVAIRMGATVSSNLARRRLLARWSELASIRLFYRFADAIVTPSRGAAEDLARVAGLPLTAVTAIPSPVVNERMLAASEQAADHPWFAAGEPPVILGVGELCARKDFSTLLRAFALLRKRRPCRLLIGGEGRKRDELLKLARELGVAADVELPGFLDNPYAYMRRAGAFALSSTSEGSPVVLMEALALGASIVAADCPSGPREILGEGRYGILVPMGDAEAMAAGLASALNHPPPAESLREAAAPYTVANSATAYLEALGFDARGAKRGI
jgi:glycosyltransferase involved in cell wall biosynthesis